MQPLPMRKIDPMLEEYVLTCQHEGCGGVRHIHYVESGGLKLGERVPSSQADPDHGRCQRCKRHKMVVTSAPAPHPPPKPVGFTRVPTR